MRGDERDALDMVPVITTALLEEHQLVTGIVVIVDPGVCVCVLAAGIWLLVYVDFMTVHMHI